jgi:uncharacterized repeat protein (TIGR01451 family)
MSKVKQIVATALLVPVAFAGVAAANPAGQIEGGDIYRVRNITKSGAFEDPTKADACETVQFRVRIHNPGPDALTGVTVKATLNTEASASHSSTVTVSATNANPTSTTDTAGVNLSSAQKMSYISGSTELLDQSGAKMSTLGDTILTDGVSVPNGVGVSTEQKRFVQFEAKVDCPPTTPPVTPPTTTTTSTPAAPTKLVNTGAGSTIGIFAAATAAGAVAYRVVLGRRLSRQ